MGKKKRRVRALFRAVSTAELTQIRTTGRFELGGGAEGKYFWEHLRDARWFAADQGIPYIVRARYDEASMAGFYRWAGLDGRAAARFADADQMNAGLDEISEVD